MKRNGKSKKQSLHVRPTIIGLIALTMAIASCSDDDPVVQPWEAEIAQLKAAVEPFKNFEAAQQAGYDIQATEYRTGMGYHFLNAGLLDGTFDPAKPEVLMFITDPMGKMELVGVEYGIPIEDLDNPGAPPEGFAGSDDVWKVDNEFSLWTLHAWVVMDNHEGIFTPMNPMLP